MNIPKTLIYSYERTKYSFFEWIQKIFNFNTSLEEIYKLNTNSIQLTFNNDTKTIYQKQFYNSEYYEEFRNLYYSFIINEIFPLFPEEEYLVIQKDPCIRVSNPNNTALGLKNEDTDEKIGLHCDSDYNHPKEEVNYIIAITEMMDSNSVYIESELNSNKYEAVTLRWNEYLQFYGNKLRHYNVKNISGLSRVSLDFRVIPFSKYSPNYNNESVHGKRKFILNDYYIKISKNTSQS